MATVRHEIFLIIRRRSETPVTDAQFMFTEASCSKPVDGPILLQIVIISWATVWLSSTINVFTEPSSIFTRRIRCFFLYSSRSWHTRTHSNHYPTEQQFVRYLLMQRTSKCLKVDTEFETSNIIIRAANLLMYLHVRWIFHASHYCLWNGNDDFVSDPNLSTSK